MMRTHLLDSRHGLSGDDLIFTLNSAAQQRAATGAADTADAARGWAAFAQAIAATAVPVFARGRLARTDLAFAQRQGAHGVALVIGAG